MNERMMEGGAKGDESVSTGMTKSECERERTLASLTKGLNRGIYDNTF